MFIEALILAAIQLGLATICYALASRSGSGGVAAAVALMACDVLLGLCLLLSPLLLAQAAVLVGVALLLRIRKWSTGSFVATGAIASAVLFLALGIRDVLVWSAARQEFPLVSLGDRLGYEDRIAAAATEERDTHVAVQVPDKQLEQFEGVYAQDHRAYLRTMSLQKVHASYVEQFIESPGFGVGRGIRPSPRWIRLSDAPVVPVAQPVPAVEPARSAADTDLSQPVLDPEPPFSPGANAVALHETALVDFANPVRFGYARNRQQVAGFESHRFTQVPATYMSQWRTTRVELVSLLKHDRPMVYVSKNLPRMDELRDAPVRPLDAFEQTALAALEQGEEVVSQTHGDRLRMLGAVRAVQQCLDCHQVKRGAMLGAFSYELRSKRPVENPPDEPKLPTEAL